MGRRSFSRSPSRGRGRGIRRSFSRDRFKRGRGRSYSRSVSRSRSDSRSSRSSYSSRSSSGSRSRSRGRSRSRSNESKKDSKSRSPSPDDGASLHVANLTRNVNSDHLSEIFGKFGAVDSVNIETDKVSRLSKGFAYIQFAKRADAETAQLHMDEGQIDGNKIKVPHAASRGLAFPTKKPLATEWRSPWRLALSQTKPTPQQPTVPERSAPSPRFTFRPPRTAWVAVAVAVAPSSAQPKP
ncbi:arginine/serine-rich protein 45 isoform X1 [Achlya hypogyna]|uniref:Arginine/serine-rich protein 45 isoform X1 n=1 Tax=Achlya hypogyna TaxID=1202772 RepID=A0A1V9ZG61_ACHHY|nr:arginine/serine-rich protein 45 isoform X1 [Achlya hypogyna]